MPGPDQYPGGGSGAIDLTGTALDYLLDIRTRTGATATNIYKLWRSLTDGVIAITNGNIDLGVQSYQVFRYGGIIDEPTLGLVGEAGYPEAVIPMMDGYNIPVKWVNGGSTQAGANGEEIELLRELVELQKEQIDTLKAKDTAPKVNVNIDGQGMVAEAGRYVSEKSRRGTLDVRAH